MAMHPSSMTHEQRDQLRYRPAGWVAVRSRSSDSVVFYGEDVRGRPAACAFKGKAVKAAWRYWFRSVGDRSKRIAGFFEADVEAVNRKAEAVATRKAFRHDLEIGDVLVSSWGYDQTNIDYYQVVRRSAKCVWIRPIARHVEHTGSMQGDCIPLPGEFTGGESRHVVSVRGRVRLSSFQSARKEEPREVAGVTTWPVAHWTAYA